MTQSERGFFPHSELLNLIDLTERFYLPTPDALAVIKKETDEVVGLVKTISGVEAVLGVGYPYYVVDNRGRAINVAEINDFLYEVRDEINNDKLQNPMGWRCPNCQEEQNLPDLKTFCKPCNLVGLKPRKIFKAVPDLDIILVANNPSMETEKQIQSKLAANGYSQTDLSIRGSVEASAVRLDNLHNGHNLGVKLPIDMHLWSLVDFDNSLGEVSKGTQEVIIPTRSLHMRWEDNPLDFRFDFLFSMTPLFCNPEVNKSLVNARIATSRIPYDHLVDDLRSSSPRATRLFESVGIETIFRERINSWRRDE